MTLSTMDPDIGDICYLRVYVGALLGMTLSTMDPDMSVVLTSTSMPFHSPNVDPDNLFSSQDRLWLTCLFQYLDREVLTLLSPLAFACRLHLSVCMFVCLFVHLGSMHVSLLV